MQNGQQTKEGTPYKIRDQSEHETYANNPNNRKMCFQWLYTCLQRYVQKSLSLNKTSSTYSEAEEMRRKKVSEMGIGQATAETAVEQEVGKMERQECVQCCTFTKTFSICNINQITTGLTSS
jgi:hypothetical protein